VSRDVPQDPSAHPAPPAGFPHGGDAPQRPAPPGNQPSDVDLDREVADAMEELLATGAAAIPGALDSGDTLEPGTELTGTIIAATGDDVFLEFGVRCQGVVPRAQFGKKEHLDAGRRVDVVVERFDADSSLLIVNRKGQIQRATWATLTVGMIVEGRITGLNKGGLEMDLKGIRAFMPASQVDVAPMKDISLLLNQMVRAEVLEVDRRHHNVLVSRRKLMVRELSEKREQLQQEIEVGQVRHGVVESITDFGAFVDLGGLTGLVHVSDISWTAVEKVSDQLQVGQELDVQVLKIDNKRHRISLGLKQTQPDPWSAVGQRYSAGEALKVRIVRLVDFGAFAEIEPGVEALIPISEMSWGRIRGPGEIISVGDLVDAVVLRVEPERRRIALSMRQATSDPWGGVLESFTANSLVHGKVTRLTDFGAFVELAPGVEGLIHISELADRRIRTCSEVVQVGEEVETRVLGVDPEQRRISLSIRAVGGAPPEAVEHAPSARHSAKKRKKPLRGGLESHWDWAGDLKMRGGQ
jgi:small subunit ribosomal protein S1